MSMYFDGIGHTVATFTAGPGAAEGQVCKVTENATVDACDSGDAFAGVVSHIDDAGAAVVLRGLVTVSYTGTAPSVGVCTLLADGAGGVAADDSGAEYLVVSANTTDNTVTILL